MCTYPGCSIQGTVRCEHCNRVFCDAHCPERQDGRCCDGCWASIRANIRREQGHVPEERRFEGLIRTTVLLMLVGWAIGVVAHSVGVGVALALVGAALGMFLAYRRPAH